jgi:hypothetical protein
MPVRAACCAAKMRPGRTSSIDSKFQSMMAILCRPPSTTATMRD